MLYQYQKYCSQISNPPIKIHHKDNNNEKDDKKTKSPLFHKKKKNDVKRMSLFLQQHTINKLKIADFHTKSNTSGPY